jgi:hypothetical protein
MLCSSALDLVMHMEPLHTICKGRHWVDGVLPMLDCKAMGQGLAGKAHKLPDWGLMLRS